MRDYDDHTIGTHPHRTDATMTLSRREIVLILVAALGAAGIVLVLVFTLGSDSGGSQVDTAAAATSTPTSTSHAPTSEDEYIDALIDSGSFDGPIEGRLRELYIIDGRDACDELRASNGDVVSARLAMMGKLADFSAEGEGMSEDGLAEKTIALVDAASLYLCPGVAAR